MDENLSPRSRKNKRASLQDAFSGLKIDSAKDTAPASASTQPSSVLRLTSCLKGSFSKGWPPTICSSATPQTASSSAGAFTLQLEEGYRVYDDRWRLDHSVVDTELDVKIEFGAAEQVMNEISAFIDSGKVSLEDMEAVILEELTLAVFGSNKLDEVGLGLDETFHLCMRILRGEIDVEYEDRTEDYQKKIDAFALKGLKSGEVKVARSRREVVQHAAAFQHMITVFVKRDQSMTEELIEETHAILVRGLSGEDASVLSSQPYGSSYRKGDERAYVGAHEFAKPSDIPKSMRALVENLQADIKEIDRTGYLDPWALAAKYCDRMDNVHPSKDDNGRMCRIILNTILIKYVGFVVALGEEDEDRDEYILAAQESGRVGGFPGYLFTMVLRNAGGTLERLKGKLRRQSKSSTEVKS
ncbi:hypothetical protein E4T47_06471 [Aureobasidium subglaciale]|nr:hypothetical protein E4T47_06471 [Aureobasidium subglaciale]